MKPGKRVSAALCIVALIAIASCDRRETTAKQDQAVPAAIRYEAHVSAGGVPPPAGTLKNPFKGDKQRGEAGAGLFSSMNCDGCHGGGAPGWVGPSLADGRWRYGGAEDEVFQSIYYGRPQGMPAYGGVIGSDGIWMLVTYLQSLPVPDVVPTQSWEKAAAAPVAAPAPSRETAASEAPETVQSTEGMLMKYGCVACHKVDEKVIGPALTDIAAKYRNQKDAEQVLVEKVKNGGVGVWGQIPMPPNATVPDEDVNEIVKWILGLK